MKKAFKWITLEDVLFTLLFLIGSVAWAGGGSWLHMLILDGEDETKVEIQVPLSLLQVALSCVHTHSLQNGKIKIADLKGDVDFLKLIQEIQKAPDGKYVTVYEKDEDVLISKKKGKIHILVRDKKDMEKVKIALPQEILSAFTVDGDGSMDVKNLVESLAMMKGENMVIVEDGKTKVRLWIE